MESPLAFGWYETTLGLTMLLGMVVAVYALTQAVSRRWPVWPSLGLAAVALVPFIGSPLALAALLSVRRSRRVLHP